MPVLNTIFTVPKKILEVKITFSTAFRNILCTYFCQYALKGYSNAIHNDL